MQNEEIAEESAERNTEVEIPSVVVATTLKVEKKRKWRDANLDREYLKNYWTHGHSNL